MPLPPVAADLLRAAARAEDRLEHISLQPAAQPCAVVGLWLRVESLREAEQVAADLCLRALADVPAFAGWSLLGAEVPLLAPSGHSPFRPDISPSERPDQDGD
ncbi:hypothetical protein [Streptomyces sp. NRRL S-31]|uniref:hypothetical protein n=1 Tax=Streptomyces sp. NRRL S-31 TaxID=1463898 RepID=UPI0020A63EE1|nr:hypothetical protein [Streptomyces sp. NRRL S-31]